MSPEAIFGIIIASVIILSFVSKLLPNRRPKEKHFKCARCGAVSHHTERIIEAWRNNKTKFFCPACHAKWLQSRPPQFSRGSAGSGCLGNVVFFAFIPLASCLLVRAYA
jgi:hypothetical protein